MSDEPDVLEELRRAARKAAEAGYYGEYLQAVVWAAVRGVVAANPNELRETAGSDGE